MLLHWHDLLDILMFQIYSSCLCLSCLGPLVNNIPKTVEICVLQIFFYCERTWWWLFLQVVCTGWNIYTCFFSWYWNIFLIWIRHSLQASIASTDRHVHVFYQSMIMSPQSLEVPKIKKNRKTFFFLFAFLVFENGLIDLIFGV